MHDGLHLAAPDLFGAATLGERRDGCDRLRVGLLFQDRFEVPVQPAELGGKLLLRRGAAGGDPLRRLLLQVAERSEEHTSELQSRLHLVCRLLLEKKKKTS